MTDTSHLPEGSTLVGIKEFDNYRIEIYIQPNTERHAVIRPKKHDANGRPLLGRMYTDMAKACTEVTGRPNERYSLGTNCGPVQTSALG